MTSLSFQKLGTLTSLISSGSTPLGGASRYLSDGPVTFLRSQNVLMNRLDLSDVAFIDDSIHAEMRRTHVQRGDVLINITGASIGRVAPFDFDGRKANVNQHVCIIRPNPDVLDFKYLTTYLSTPLFQDKIDRLQRGGTRQALTFNMIADFDIPLPTLPVQRQIAALLDKADTIRRKREEGVRLTEELLRSTFLEMFGDPATNPKRWKKVLLKERCEMITGFPFPSDQFVKTEGVRLCRGANVLPDTIDWSDVRHLPVNDFAKYSHFELLTGDVVLAMDRPWISSGLKVAIVSDADLPSLLVQRVARLRSNSHFCNPYIYCLLRNSFFKRHCDTTITETTIPHISPNDIRSLLVPDPSLELMQEFADRFKRIENLISARKTGMSDSCILFDSLVQRAFQGKL